MSEINLPQSEADVLLGMEKHWVEYAPWSFPNPGSNIMLPLTSTDKREEFTLDVWRSGARLTKGRFLNRSRKVVVLARIDIDAAPHRNPDDIEVPGTHIHIYREGWGDKWAQPLPADKFPPPHDLMTLIYSFCSFCSIIQPPVIQGSIV